MQLCFANHVEQSYLADAFKFRFYLTILKLNVQRWIPILFPKVCSLFFCWCALFWWPRPKETINPKLTRRKCWKRRQWPDVLQRFMKTLTVQLAPYESVFTLWFPYDSLVVFNFVKNNEKKINNFFLTNAIKNYFCGSISRIY